jgi:hypothetical protein
VKVSFATTVGKNHRVEHTSDFLTWTFYPGAIYGMGQTADYYVYEGEPPATAPPPPVGGPEVNDQYLFFVTAFSDGSAVASWSGVGGQACKAYLASFSMLNAGQVLSGVASLTIGSTYNLTVFVGSGTKLAAYTTLTAPPGEAKTLSKLSSQVTIVKNALISQAANPSQPLTPRLFDDRGEALHQFFRVRAFELDSNFDSIPDHVQLASGTLAATYNQDLDNDGIPNGYDRDIMSQAADPARYLLLSNVFINEVLMSNDFTNVDEDCHPNDWVELFNPTNASIDIGDWYLSDKGGSDRTKWTIPTGTTIGSGQFLVVWASAKNRTILASPLHTNFNYSAGNYITNENPEPVYLSRYENSTLVTKDYLLAGSTANFGPQRPDVSFGRYPIATLVNGQWRTSLQTGYMVLPTPGTQLAPGKFSGLHNIEGALGFCLAPTFLGNAPGIYTDTSSPSSPGDPEGGDPGIPASPPTVSVTISAVSGTAIHYTTNGATPSRYSELYPGSFGTNRTLIVRAIAAKDGWLPSASVTRSFLFKEDILGTSPQGTTPTDQQGARDADNKFIGHLYNYPETTENIAYPMLYTMVASAVSSNRNAISTELSNVPIVSIVSSVPEFFQVSTGGLYPNSGKTEGGGVDPRGRNWERPCSFEIIEPGNTTSKQANAAVLITGGSSILQSTTRKHNLRIKFDSTYGPEFLKYQLFPGWAQDEFYNFNLKNPTHDSWSNTWSGDVRSPATYCNEAFIRDTHRAMGHDGPNTRWCQLFINGIYWGPYQIVERIDDRYMDAHFVTGTYTVVKQNGEAVSGDYSEWQSLINLVDNFVTTPSAGKPALYQQITALVDVDNYIDYLIANTYGQNGDWPGSNWRAAKLNAVGAKWRFFIWDAEWTCRQGEQTASPVSILDIAEGPAVLHSYMKDYQPYRDAFSLRLNRAFKVIGADAGSGSLIVATAKSRFQTTMGRFDDVIYSESARWGYMAKAIPFTKSDPSYLPGNTELGDWDRSTNYILNTWLPQRQAPFLNAYQAAGLYVPIP